MTESLNCSFLSTSNSHHDHFLNCITFFLLLLYLISFQRQLTLIGIFLLLTLLVTSLYCLKSLWVLNNPLDTNVLYKCRYLIISQCFCMFVSSSTGSVQESLYNHFKEAIPIKPSAQFLQKIAVSIDFYFQYTELDLGMGATTPTPSPPSPLSHSVDLRLFYITSILQ